MVDNKKQLPHKVTLMQGGTKAILRGQIMIYQNQNARDLILFSTITTEISISLRNKGIYVLN